MIMFSHDKLLTINFLSLIVGVQFSFSHVKYYYQDFTTILHPFVLPNDSYNLWFERRSDNQLISIPLRSVRLKATDSLADVYGFYIDHLIFLVTLETDFLLSPQSKTRVLKAKQLNLTNDQFANRQLKPIPFSRSKFLVTSVGSIGFRKQSVNQFNIIEQYSLVTSARKSKSADSPVDLINLQDTISLPLDGISISDEKINFQSQIVDQVYDENFTFILLKLSDTKETNYLLIRFCKTKQLSSMIGLKLIIVNNQQPRTLSLAILGDKQIMLISFSNQSTGSIEVYDVDDLHSVFDSIGNQCYKAQSPKNVHLLPKMMIKNEKSKFDCKPIDTEYNRCSTSSLNQYIIGTGNSLIKSRLIRKDYENPIIGSKIVTISWPDSHVLIVLLSPNGIYKCILIVNLSIDCQVIDTKHLGKPKPLINFIHHTGLFRVDYIGEKGETIDYHVNLIDCESFDDCITCRSYGFLWGCVWKSFKCSNSNNKNRNSSDSCFRIGEIYNRAYYSDEHGSLIIHLKNVTKSIQNLTVNVLIENTKCEVTKLNNDSIECEYNGPINDLIQLQVKMTPETNFRPQRSISELKRTTIIDKPRISDHLGIFDGPDNKWILPILVASLLTASITISYIVQRVAI